MNDTLWIILFGAIVTYLTRAGGHWVLSRFDRIHPRVEAGLNAAPAAVLTTLVAPAAVSAGPAEWLSLAIAGVLALRFSTLTAFLISAVVLVALRQVMA